MTDERDGQVTSSDACTHVASTGHPGEIVGHMPDGRVRVAVQGGSACDRCAAGRGCGLGLHQAVSHIDCRIEACDRVLPVGTAVHVQVDETSPSGWLRVVAGAYGFPVVGLLAGVVFSGSVLNVIMGPSSGIVSSSEFSASVRDGWVALGGLAGLAGGLLAWRLLASRRGSAGIEPRATPVERIVQDEC